MKETKSRLKSYMFLITQGNVTNVRSGFFATGASTAAPVKAGQRNRHVESDSRNRSGDRNSPGIVSDDEDSS